MSHNNQKKVAVINDFSGFGRCSIAVSLPILSAMKIQCCPLPTAIFSNHTGFDSFFVTDYTESMVSYFEEWKKLDLRFNAIEVGFLGSHRQIELVERFINEFKTENTLVIIDPVMGDYGKLYKTYNNDLVNGVKELVQYADVLTPNLTEACILTNTNYNPDISREDLSVICDKLQNSGAKNIVISGLYFGDNLGNYIYDNNKKSDLLLEKRVGSNRSGTGDVFSSIITGSLVNGEKLNNAVKDASTFVAKSIIRSEEMGIPVTDGIAFEEMLHLLIK